MPCIAINSPFRDFQHNPLLVVKAIRDHVEYRRGGAVVTAWCDRDNYSDDWWFGITIDGKKARRLVDSRESVYRAVNEMIDELWPLELMP